MVSRCHEDTDPGHDNDENQEEGNKKEDKYTFGREKQKILLMEKK